MSKRLNLIWWYGGKGLLFKKILPYLQTPHTLYVEPYAGGASVFLNKPPSKCEVLNDIDREIVNLFRVLQDPQKYAELQHRLNFTLYSRDEFVRALDIIQNDAEQNDVMRAWAFFVAQNQGFAGIDCRRFSFGTWGRIFSKNVADCFSNKVEQLHFISKRLKHVQLDNIDALDCIRYWDSPDTLFYIDPPYIYDTRKNKNVYNHEADDDHHNKLVEVLLNIKGQAVLSGYEHDIYAPLLQAGWKKVEFETVCHAAGKTRNSNLQGKGSATKYIPRVEVLYIHTREQNLFTLNVR